MSVTVSIPTILRPLTGDRMSSVPFIWRTRRLTIERPRPVPCPIGLVVKKGSNALASTSAGMPAPVSETEMAT